MKSKRGSKQTGAARTWILGLALVVLVIFFGPVFLNIVWVRYQPYQQVLNTHKSHPPRHGIAPVAMITFFPDGSPSYGEMRVVYASSPWSRLPWIENRRYLTYAVQGGGSGTDLKTFGQIKSLPPLPPSQVSPNPLWVRNLVIASKLENGVWQTRYYDRRNMPRVVRNLGLLSQACYNDRNGHFISLVDGHVVSRY